MGKYAIRALLVSLAVTVSFALFAAADELQAIQLPEPETEGGMPLMEALKLRRTTRSFDTKPLPEQKLSNLLWAAFGINRPERGMRTAPSAVNWQEIDIYVSMEQGLFLYNPRENRLDPILAEDIREMVGVQAFTQVAPVNLIYVADRSRMRRASEEDKDFYSATDTGFISQNVYLFAASEGLATVVIGMVRREPLAEKMGLRDDQRIILCQPVGYPAE